MAGFDVSFMNPKLRRGVSKDYGYLVDQLLIYQNQLEADGELSPGDYDLLIKKAREIYAHPGLSIAQRSNVQVKISEYQQKKSTLILSDLNDIQRLNNGVKEDHSRAVMMFANNPQILLTAQSDALRVKLGRLTQSIEQLTGSGADYSRHMLEYRDTLTQYNDSLQALDDANKPAGPTPSQNTIAYVTANPNGEVTDVAFGKIGSKLGYVETNGMYGNFQMYAKVNRKEEGSNIFQIGNQTFSAADIVIPDPANPGSMKAPKLTATPGQKPMGPMTTVTAGQWQPVDLSNVRAQSIVRTGGYAKGPSGFLYEKLDNGKYRKYVHADQKLMNIPDYNILPVPSEYERIIAQDAQETVDAADQPMVPSAGSIMQAPQAASTASMTQGMQPASMATPMPAGTSRTPSPTERVGNNQQNIFQKTFQSARDFLGGLFNR